MPTSLTANFCVSAELSGFDATYVVLINSRYASESSSFGKKPSSSSMGGARILTRYVRKSITELK